MQSKDMISEFPLRMTLTPDGVTYFIQNKIPFEKMVLADGIVEHGVRWNTFSPKFLQQFLLADRISRIEISRTEFKSKRADIMDLAKLLVYGILYKQMDSEFFRVLLDSEVVKKWNRMNTTSILDEKSAFDKQILDRVIKEKQPDIKKAVLAPVAVRINSNSELERVEKARKIQTAEKFLTNLNGVIWFVLTEFERDQGYLDLVGALRKLLERYLDKTDSAENLALTLMELLLDAEKRNMSQFVKKHFGEKVNVEQLLYDEVSRKRVFSGMEAAKAYVYLSWKISPGVPGRRNKLQIFVYNRESDYYEVNQLLEENKQINTNKMSLVDFYNAAEGAERPEMGLHYLSYLSEACSKVDIRFDSIVNQIKERDLTVITLTLLF